MLRNVYHLQIDIEICAMTLCRASDKAGTLLWKHEDPKIHSDPEDML